jgi:sulfoxide reductase heme-binding subunit YedZ
MQQNILIHYIFKHIIWALCLSPLVGLVWLFHSGGMTANPIEFLNRYLGEWSLKFLLFALIVTPLREITGWAGVAPFRRLLGLFAFFYAILHFASYIGIDQFFNWKDIWTDLIKRTYITVGLGAFTILAVLAATSTKNMIRKLGGKTWKRLHKWVYVAGLAGCLHFFMMRKGVQAEPLYYLMFLVLLLAYRWVSHIRKQRQRTSQSEAQTQA